MRKNKHSIFNDLSKVIQLFEGLLTAIHYYLHCECVCVCVCVCVHVCFSHVRLCDPMDCSPSGSSVREIISVRILEWVAMYSFKGSFQPRD